MREPLNRDSSHSGEKKKTRRANERDSERVRCLGKLKTKEYEDKEDGSEGVVKAWSRSEGEEEEGKRGQGEKQSSEETERSVASGQLCVCVEGREGGGCGWLRGGCAHSAKSLQGHSRARHIITQGGVDWTASSVSTSSAIRARMGKRTAAFDMSFAPCQIEREKPNWIIFVVLTSFF